MPKIRDFLERDDLGRLTFTQEKKKTRTYTLDSSLDKNPAEYCPDCDSKEIRDISGSHSTDSWAYNCGGCGLEYTILLE